MRSAECGMRSEPVRHEFETGLATEGSGPENQDRAGVVERPTGLVLVVADGVGGIGGGAEAAQLVIDLLREASVTGTDFLDPLIWCGVLTEIDRRLAAHPSAGEPVITL